MGAINYTVGTSGVEGGNQFINIEISAVSDRRAEKKVKRIASAKGYSNPETDEIEVLGSSTIPGMQQYRVKVLSPR